MKGKHKILRRPYFKTLNFAGYLSSGFEIFVSVFAVIKFVLLKVEAIRTSTNHAAGNTVLVLLCLLMTSAIVPLIALVIFNFWLVRHTLELYLKRRHGENFGGLLGTGDSLCSVETYRSRYLLSIACAIQYNNSRGDFKDFVRKFTSERLMADPRFKSTRQTCLGYHYLLNNQVTVDDIIFDMRPSGGKAYSKEDFETIVQENSNAPLPKDNTATLEVIVGREPVVLNADAAIEQYPVIVKIHHSVGDGVTLASYALKHIADEAGAFAVNGKEVKSGGGKTKELKVNIGGIARAIRNLSEVKVHLLPLFAKRDRNILHGPVLSGEKRIAFYAEGKENYLRKVKEMKKKMPGSTFSDVILTALSASFNEHFLNNSSTPPEYVTLILPLSRDISNLQYKADYLGNDSFTLSYIRLPVDVRDENNARITLLNRMHLIRDEIARYKGSADAMISYWLVKVVSFLPAPVIKTFGDLAAVSTLCLSNLPGFKKVNVMGHPLNHMFFWIPNISLLGIGVSILTYDDRFQMGIIVDKALIENRIDVQNILDNVFKYIDAIDLELQEKIYKN